MRILTDRQVQAILEEHALWLKDRKQGNITVKLWIA